MNTKYLISALLVLFIAIIGCEKDPDLKPRNYPYVITLDESKNTSSGVTINGEVFYSSGNITEYGFVINKGGNPSLQDYVISKNGDPGKGEYSQRITTGLEPEEDYYVKSFVRSDQLVVYGNEIKFKSEGTPMPVITGFSPLSGRAGDEVTITGNYFSPYAPWNIVFFDEHPASVVSASETKLVVIVPEIQANRQVTISIGYGFLFIDAAAKFNNIYP